VSPALDRAGGSLAAAAPFAPALGVWASGEPAALPGLAVGAALAGGAFLLHHHLAPARLLASGGVVGALALAAPRLAVAPAQALVALLIAATALAALWMGRRPDERSRRSPRELARQARAACWILLPIWALVASSGASAGVALGAGVIVSWLIVAALLLAWLRASGPRPGRRAALALAASAGAAAAALEPASAVPVAGLLPAVALVLARDATRRPRLAWLEPILHDPARLLISSFLVLCGAGGLALLLPACTASGRSLGLADALFTAVSAACVTGLIVVDTPTALSPLGQAIVLLLIQLGGLGIMAFSTTALSLLGRRISLRYEGAVAGLMGERDRGRIVVAMKRLVVFTAVTEAVGWALLAGVFLRAGESLPQALWRGLFTAVSAFCNAGFALQTDSLMGYSRDPAVLHVVAALIVVGGLSPAGAAGLGALLRGRRASAQAKLLLSATAVLLAVGTLSMAALEWRGTLAGMTVLDRLHNAWFQSVTLRTAGFNSIDVAAVSPATLAVMMVWMFVGGGPGGTAGGVKVTTASALLLGAVAAIRGREAVEAFGRRIPHRSVYRAAAIATLGAALVLAASITLLLTQRLGAREAVFEVVSAVGTVGLSAGATAKLDTVGKAVIMACMFLGRVGPLSAFMLLTRRQGGEPVWRLPEEEIDVG